MKKLLKVLGLSVACGALTLALVEKSQAKESKATNYESYIKVDAGFFTNWTDDAGGFGDQNSTFWGENYSFQAVDTFYRGELKEGWQGTLTSRTWKQREQYIYFQLGGANNYVDLGDAVHLNIHYGNYQYAFYNDTFRENRMLMRYFKIPDNAYNDLMSKGDDFDMFIEIVDYQYENYGFANFGYLNVNQTEEQVSNALRWYVNHLNRDSREEEVNMRKLILDNYFLNAGLRELFLKSVDDISDNFETQSDFENHWYFDYYYADKMNWDYHIDRAIGHDEYRPESSTNMPFNKSDNGFFRGWFENDEVGGFVGGDASKYRFVSRPFTLKGTGLVSIKMAGTASLHVIDTATQSDLVWADLITYNKQGNLVNLATSSFNTVTMVRHLINLEAYLGRTIQLAIADVSDGDWSALYVDELVTNYESYPGLKVDTFTQINDSGTFNAYRKDVYINSTVFNGETNPTGLKYVLENEINKADDNFIINHQDDSAIKDAYEFLDEYYSSLRSPANKFDYFEASEEVRNGVVSSYEELTQEAKDIVDNSSDIEYKETFSEEWWSNLVDTSNKVGTNILELLEKEIYNISFDANGAAGSMSSLSKEEGDVYALPACTFIAPEGKQFAGWLVNDDTTLRDVGYEITIYGDVVLTAQWEDIPLVSYTISFDGNGAEGSMQSLVKGEGTTYILPNCGFITPEGYQFSGWLIDEEVKQPGETILVSNDIVIVAQWAEIPVTYYGVSLDPNGGTGFIIIDAYEEGYIFTLPECPFTAPEGYEFAGWRIEDEETLREPGYSFAILSDLEIFAEWKALPATMYVVSFNSNGGSGSMASLSLEEGTIYQLPQSKFTAPEGYEFAGWRVNEEETLRQPREEINISGDVILTAEWKLLPVVYFTVSFDANGGSGSMESITVVKGEQFTLPTCSFVAPEGYTFDYWLISSVKYQPGDKITVVGDTLIKASWKKIEQDKPEEQPEEEKQEENNKGFFETIAEVFKNFFKMISDFFKNLFN